MHTSTKVITFMRCGHAIHRECYNEYIKSRRIACPICKKSLCDPKLFEAQMDAEIAMTPMPAEYKDLKMNVLCNDCLAKSNVSFHVLPGKCLSCSSYNTTRIEGDAINVNLPNVRLNNRNQED